MTKERPLLLNGPMVRAVLDGLKTQTRMPMKPQPTWVEDPTLCDDGIWRGRYVGATVALDSSGYPYPEMSVEVCEVGPSPFGQPGDVLWVREAWRTAGSMWDGYRRYVEIEYRADDEPRESRYCHVTRDVYDSIEIDQDDSPWRPSIHMPRWASRLLLRVERVWVERVQEITPEDAIAEGVPYAELTKRPDPHHVSQFADLWDSIYDKRDLGWYANPWVWACEFSPTHDAGKAGR